MTSQAQRKQKTKSKSNILMYGIIFLVAVAIGVYWYNTKDEAAETYRIHSSNGDEFYGEKSYINLMGKEAEEKKIKLSEDYWTSGKFDFK